MRFALGVLMGACLTWLTLPAAKVAPSQPTLPVQATEADTVAVRSSPEPCGPAGFVDHVMTHLTQVPAKYLQAMGTACQSISMDQRQMIAKELQRRRKASQ